MDQQISHGTPLAQWLTLVADAQHAAGCVLHTDIESYLVFTLMRYVDSNELCHHAMGEKYLQYAQSHGAPDELRDIGDQCLLTAGLFPGRAVKRLLRVGYFVDLGRSAYHQLSDVLDDGRSEIYHQLSYGFVHMMDVLLTMREMGNGYPCLDPVCAHELWSDTGSRHALRAMQMRGDVMPFPVVNRRH